MSSGWAKNGRSGLVKGRWRGLEIRHGKGQPIESRISALRPKLDLFFDKVLVNAPDEAVRRNRLTLLHNLLTEFSEIADFSEIVTERETRNEER